MSDPGRPFVVAAAAALLLAGCSDGGEPRARGSATFSASVAASSSTALPAPPAASATGTTSAAATPTPAPTLAPVQPGPTVTNAPGSGPAAPPAGPTEIGRYPATQQGSEQFSDGSAPTTRQYPSTTALVVRAGARPDERIATIDYSPDRSDVYTLRFTAGRIDLVSARGTVRVGTFEQTRTLAPSPPILTLPAAARVGQTFTGRFSGESTGRYDGRVLRRETLTVGGTSVSTVLVDLTVVIESGPTTGTIRTTTHWDPARSLPVRQTTESQLRDALSTYTQRVTVALSRLTPA